MRPSGPKIVSIKINKNIWAYLVLLYPRKNSIPSYLFDTFTILSRRPVNHESLAEDQFSRHSASIPTVLAVITVVPHYKIVILSNSKWSLGTIILRDRIAGRLIEHSIAPSSFVRQLFKVI